MEDGWIREEKSFKTNNEVILKPTNLDQYYDTVSEKLMSECEDFQEKESGWTLDEIIELEVTRLNQTSEFSLLSVLESASSFRSVLQSFRKYSERISLLFVLNDFAPFPSDFNIKRSVLK
ncbi:hypothetical protein AVEN_250298-1 [Araneus ventricosus]|uniref:Uncharacterized protein n=1 Tax=Araneus ventricosus TaxID=182803 RepID=A0A4Y2FI94_ARAVE|nr:hypothetical protein AVEN_250298-1 [Araneus ventricosus]